MKRLHPFSPGLALALSFLFFSANAQIINQGVIIQPAGSDNVVFEAESYALLVPPNPNDPALRSWTEETNANACGNRVLRATGTSTAGTVNNGTGLTRAKVFYYIKFSEPGTYYLYLRYFASSGNSASLFVPSALNKPGQVFLENLPVSPQNFQWEQFSTTANGGNPVFYTVSSADVNKVCVLAFSPREPDFLLDRIVLHKLNNLTGANLDGCGVLNNTFQGPLSSPDGLLKYSSFEGTGAEWGVASSSFADLNVTYPAGFNNTGIFWPYLGEHFLALDKNANSGPPSISMDPVLVNCYQDLTFCFRWFFPVLDGSSMFEATENLTGTVTFYNASGVIVGSKNLFLIPGTTLNSVGDCYQQECYTVFDNGDADMTNDLPGVAVQAVITIVLNASAFSEDIFIDEVLLSTSDLSAAPKAFISGNCTPPGAQVNLSGSGSSNALTYTWFIFDNSLTFLTQLSGPNISYSFTANGTYFVCLLVTDGCGNSHILCKEVIINTPVLPVELLSFTARPDKGKAVLEWQTATELNNDLFEVQHSTNGRDFKIIAEIDGKGTTLEPQSYVYLHDLPVPGINFYRLRQVDFDGRYEFSRMVSLLFEQDKTLQLFPNPATSVVQVQFTAEGPQVYRIISPVGALIRKGKIENGGQIVLENLSSGIYFLQLLDEKGIPHLHNRFIKTNE